MKIVLNGLTQKCLIALRFRHWWRFSRRNAQNCSRIVCTQKYHCEAIWGTGSISKVSKLLLQCEWNNVRNIHYSFLYYFYFFQFQKFFGALKDGPKSESFAKVKFLETLILYSSIFLFISILPTYPLA